MSTTFNELHPAGHASESVSASVEAGLKKTKVIYWAVTIFLSAVLLMAGASELMKNDMIVEVMDHLGYPLYVATILGVLKIAGVLALLFPPCVEVKEWAYAGFTFDLLGATTSHLTVGDPVAYWSKPFSLFVVLAISYVLWKKITLTRQRHDNLRA